MTGNGVRSSTFKPAWWLPGAHLQTLFPFLFRNQSPPPLERERLELQDGDFLDIDWSEYQSGPLVVLLHGLEGSIRSHYVAGMLNSLTRCGFQVALVYFRGCSGEPNRLPRSYHSGETGDLETVLRHLKNKHPARPIFAIGISLGGNVLLKYLGTNSDQNMIARAVAISVPFELNAAALQLQQGFSRLYQFYLLRKLRRSTRLKAERVDLPVDTSRLGQLRTFRLFDDQVTAPLHGFQGVDAYYRLSSSRQYLAHIMTDTLILHARNDPFLGRAAIPGARELGPGVRLELSDNGGHVGFIAGKWPWRPCYWLDQRVCDYLTTDLKSAN